MLQPRNRTITRRKEIRREIRLLLGTSSEEAPGPYAALRIATELQSLLDIATGGRYGLAIVDFYKDKLGIEDDYGTGRFVSPRAVLYREHRARDEELTRKER